MRDIQMDEVSLLFEDLLPIIKNLKDEKFDENDSVYWKNKLSIWNGNHSINSLEATIFQLW